MTDLPPPAADAPEATDAPDADPDAGPEAAEAVLTATADVTGQDGGLVPPMDGALQITVALAYAGFDVVAVAGAVVSNDVYPALTALQLGTVLLDPTAFPATGKDQMASALTATGRYTQAEVQAAIAALYSGARRLGPYGGGSSYYGQPVAFDDLSFALDPQRGPIVALSLRTGDVIDAVQVHYQAGSGPWHGGNGGQERAPLVFPGDPPLSIFGHTGVRWGGVYVIQIGVRTRSRPLGPVGGTLYPGDQSFEMRANSDEQIIALYGETVLALRYNAPPSDFVDKLGCYAKPL
jgi:hypothetical protein